MILPFPFHSYYAVSGYPQQIIKDTASEAVIGIHENEAKLQ